MLNIEPPQSNMIYEQDEKAHILVVDDDRRIRGLLNKYLTAEGYHVSSAANVKDAECALNEFIFDLIILDVMMPGETGLSFALRNRDPNTAHSLTPIVMLTALGETNHRILGYEAGIDDYITKPFDPRELSLRISNILRRTKKTTSFGQFIQFGGCFFNTDTAVLYRNMQVVILTSRERDLLRILVKNANQIVSRQTLLLSNGRQQASERSVDVDVTRLRQKIEEDPRMPKYLKTIRGYGYQLVTDISYKKIVTGALA